MIFKLGMKHQRMDLYKVCTNNDPVMTLTYYMARSTKAIDAFEWEFINKLLSRAL